MLKGNCPVCEKGSRILPSCNPDDREQKICYTCYARIKRYRAEGISRPIPEFGTEKEKETEGRPNSKHPGNEVLEQLMRDCRVNLSLMKRYLFRNKGIEASIGTISKWILKERKLRELAVEIRENRLSQASYLSKAKVPQPEKPAKEQTGYIPRQVSGLPLSKEELEVLNTPGESAEEIAGKLQKAGGRISLIRENILFKKNAATLEEVREKLGIVLEPQKEVVKE